MSEMSDKEQVNEENLNDIALHNIQLFINEEKNPLLNNNFILKKNKFIANDETGENEDNLDIIYSLTDLENPIYFTFHQSIDILYLTDKNNHLLVKVLLSALEKVEEYYSECKDTNLYLENMLNDIEFKLMNYYHKHYGRSICSRFMNHLSNKLYDFLMDCSKEVFKHYNFTDFISGSEDDDDSDNESEGDNDNNE